MARFDGSNVDAYSSQELVEPSGSGFVDLANFIDADSNSQAAGRTIQTGTLQNLGQCAIACDFIGQDIPLTVNQTRTLVVEWDWQATLNFNTGQPGLATVTAYVKFDGDLVIGGTGNWLLGTLQWNEEQAFRSELPYEITPTTPAFYWEYSIDPQVANANQTVAYLVLQMSQGGYTIGRTLLHAFSAHIITVDSLPKATMSVFI